MSSLIDELKRRNIFRVATAYGVASWVILQLCDILFPAVGINEADIRYVVIVLGIGFPVLLALAWYFEITPDGFRPTRQVDGDESISHQTARRIDLVIILLLSLALVFFASEYFQKDEPDDKSRIAVDKPPEETDSDTVTLPAIPVDTRPSIAVLPFVNMSSDAENEYFSDGLSEELLNVLAQIGDLRVAGRTSSFFYKGKNENLKDIGRALNVSNILEGSVRKSGSKVRITAQLISADDGFHLWSRTFDREIEDIFAIQDEISSEVAMAMKVTLLTDGVSLPESRLTSNPEAHDLYLRAKEALYQREEESVQLAIDLFKMASQLDPEYAPPLIGLADANLILQNNHGSLSLQASTDIAKEALDRAAALDYQTSDYWATLGLYHQHLSRHDPIHNRLAAQAYKQALALNKDNVNANMWYAALLTEDADPGNDPEGFALVGYALTLDPLNRIANQNYQIQLAANGRIEEAVRNLERLIRLDPDYPSYVSVLIGLYLGSSRYIEAAKLLKRIPQTDSRFPFVVLTFVSGMNDEALIDNFFSNVATENPLFEVIQSIGNYRRATAAELIAEARVQLLQPDYEGNGRSILSRLIEVGEYRLAIEVIENMSPALREEQPEFEGLRPFGLQTYVIALYLDGRKKRAAKIADIMLDMNSGIARWGFPAKGAEDATYYLVKDDPSGAIKEIELAYQEGWRGYYGERMERDPLFKDIIDRPEIQSVKQKTDQFIREFKPELIRELEAAGAISPSI